MDLHEIFDAAGVSLKVPIAVLALLVVVIFFLLFIIWSIKRHREPHLRMEAEGSFESLVKSLAGLSLGVPVGGNRVEIFENGAFFDVLLDHMGKAERTLHFEAFL